MNTALVNKLRGNTIPVAQQHSAIIGGIDYATNITYPLAISSAGAIPVTTAPGGVVDVNIVEAAGMSINVTAGDIDIHLSDGGANPDSVRIGDGTDTLAINTDGSINSSAAGKTAVTILSNDYSSVNVTTAAYVQLIASTASQINYLDVFDSSGQILTLAFGAAASEVDQIRIHPNGNGGVPLRIPAGTRVSIKAFDANATTGRLSINCLS